MKVEPISKEDVNTLLNTEEDLFPKTEIETISLDETKKVFKLEE